MNWRERFHAHLDECKQCREHPMNLCHAGTILLESAAQEAIAAMAERARTGDLDVRKA